MARVTCEAKRRGIVKRRGTASIEFYIEGKPQYYCFGYYDKGTDVPFDVCRKCRDFIENADADYKTYRNGRRANQNENR